MDAEKIKGSIRPSVVAAIIFAFLAGLISGVAYIGLGTDRNRHPQSTDKAKIMEFTTRGSAGEFLHQDRVRFRKALERIRYELLAEDGSPPFDQMISDELIEARVREEEKKERLLKEHCDIEITEEMVRDEIARMKKSYRRTDVLLLIAEALDNDPRAIVEFWIKPILVDRYLLACVAYDREINAAAREKAMAVKHKLERGDPAGLEFTRVLVRVSSEDTEPEDRQALSSIGEGEVSEVIESLYDFHIYKAVSRQGDTVAADSFSIKKPDMEDWLESRP
jgi:hypothetical protein